MKVFLQPTNVIMADLGIDDKGPVHAFFTEECARYMDQFVPFRSGMLAETVIKDGVINEENFDVDTITYKQEYASYVYYGITKNGNIMNYSTDKHENAGPYWDEFMWSAYNKEITQNVQRYLERGSY